MVRVFLSHAADADAAARERLAADLRAAGVKLWMAPDSIAPGESFPAAIDRGLASSDYFVALLSPASLASRWVQAEVNAAIARALDEKLTVLPVVVSAVAVPPLLSTFQQIDLKNYEEGLARLAGALGVSIRSVAGIVETAAAGSGRQLAPTPPQDAFVANVCADLERGARRFHYIVQRAPPSPGSVLDSIVEVALLRIGVAVWPEGSATTGRMLAEIERELRTNEHRVAAVLGIASGESTTVTPFQLLDAASPNAMVLTWNESDGSDAIGASIDLVVRHVTGHGPPLSPPGGNE
jgi:TIR domain